MNKYPPASVTWTPESGMWIENYFPYKLCVLSRAWRVKTSQDQDPFPMIKDHMQKSRKKFGEYREEWIGHCSGDDQAIQDAFYFLRLDQAKAWVQNYLLCYDNIQPDLKISAWIRGPKDEVLDINTFEEMTVEYPYCVEISLEHDGIDIQDWLLENGFAHNIDWKAIRMTHKNVWAVYFKNANQAVMTKLRWGGVEA